jgi:hypothetical protein
MLQDNERFRLKIEAVQAENDKLRGQDNGDSEAANSPHFLRA